MLESHLLCHSDSEGMYLPIDFGDVIFAGPDAGVVIGSSPRLRAELASIAPNLGIDLTDGELDDEAANTLAARVSADPAPELVAWFDHWEKARLSIAHRTAIVYR